MTRFFAPLLIVLCLSSFASASLVINIGGSDITDDGPGNNGSDLDVDAVVLTFYDSSENGTTGYGLDSNEVQLDVFFKGGGALGSAQVHQILFNLKGNPTAKPDGLDITSTDGRYNGYGFAGGHSQKWKYGQRGLFDLKVDFQGFKLDDPNNDQTVSLIIKTTADLTVDMFDESSTDKIFFAAAHIGDTGNMESGHYGGLKSEGSSNDPVPEPATVAIWSILGLCGIGGARYQRRKAE